MNNVNMAHFNFRPFRSKQTMPRKKIMIIDHQSIFRMGLMMAIKHPLPEVHVTEAANLREALENCKSADLVLIDCAAELGDQDAVVAQLKQSWPDAKVIVMFASRHADGFDEAMASGADEYLSKSLLSSQIVSTIASMLEGTKSNSSFRPMLTQRQLEVLEAMSKGMSNKMIAQNYGISEHTVRWHVQLILTALEASSRCEAIFIARSFGIIS